MQDVEVPDHSSQTHPDQFGGQQPSCWCTGAASSLDSAGPATSDWLIPQAVAPRTSTNTIGARLVSEDRPLRMFGTWPPRTAHSPKQRPAQRTPQGRSLCDGLEADHIAGARTSLGSHLRPPPSNLRAKSVGQDHKGQVPMHFGLHQPMLRGHGRGFDLDWCWFVLLTCYFPPDSLLTTLTFDWALASLIKALSAPPASTSRQAQEEARVFKCEACALLVRAVGGSSTFEPGAPLGVGCPAQVLLQLSGRLGPTHVSPPTSVLSPFCRRLSLRRCRRLPLCRFVFFASMDGRR